MVQVALSSKVLIDIIFDNFILSTDDALKHMNSSEGTSFGLLAFGLYLSYYLFSHISSNSFLEFQQLFSTQRLVHVSTIDFTILSLAVRFIHE